jgi:hypothetical protein
VTFGKMEAFEIVFAKTSEKDKSPEFCLIIKKSILFYIDAKSYRTLDLLFENEKVKHPF